MNVVSSGTIHDNPWAGVEPEQDDDGAPQEDDNYTTNRRTNHYPQWLIGSNGTTATARRGRNPETTAGENTAVDESSWQYRQRQRLRHFTCTDWTLHSLVQMGLGLDLMGCFVCLVYGWVLYFHYSNYYYHHHHSGGDDNNNNDDDDDDGNHTTAFFQPLLFQQQQPQSQSDDVIVNGEDDDEFLLFWDSHDNNTDPTNHHDNQNPIIALWPAVLVLQLSLWLGVRVLSVMAALYYSHIFELWSLGVASLISAVLAGQTAMATLVTGIATVHQWKNHSWWTQPEWWHQHFLIPPLLHREEEEEESNHYYQYHQYHQDDDKNQEPDTGFASWLGWWGKSSTYSMSSHYNSIVNEGEADLDSVGYWIWEQVLVPYLWLLLLSWTILEFPIRYYLYQQYRQRLLQQEQDDLQETAVLSRAALQHRPWWWSNHPNSSSNNNIMTAQQPQQQPVPELDQLRQALLSEDHYYDAPNGNLDVSTTTTTAIGQPDWVRQENDVKYHGGSNIHAGGGQRSMTHFHSSAPLTHSYNNNDSDHQSHGSNNNNGTTSRSFFSSLFTFWRTNNENDDDADDNDNNNDGSGDVSNLDFASVQEEWASRSEEDPLWWSRNDNNNNPNRTATTTQNNNNNSSSWTMGMGLEGFSGSNGLWCGSSSSNNNKKTFSSTRSPKNDSNNNSNNNPQEAPPSPLPSSFFFGKRRNNAQQQRQQQEDEPHVPEYVNAAVARGMGAAASADTDIPTTSTTGSVVSEI